MSIGSGAARRWWSFIVILSGVGCSAGDGPPADEVQPGSLRLEMESGFPVALGYVSAVRELSDGSVMVADPTAPALLRLDFDAGTLDTLGREGDGPQEYRQPDRVYPLPGDSTLFIDLGRSRMVAVAPDGAPGEATSLLSDHGGRYPSLMHPRFVDAGGRIYYATNVARDQAPRDSVAVVRFDRGTQARDTVAMLWMPEFTRERNGTTVRVMLQAYDEWGVGADGRVAVVRANGYGVEWYGPGDAVVRGPEVPYEPYPVTDGEQEAILEDFADNAIVTRMTVGEGGVQAMTQQRGIPASMERPGADSYVWNETLPAVRTEGVVVVPWGDVWVERWVPSDEPPRVEVFGSDGAPKGQIPVPPGRRVLGVVDAGEAGFRAYLVRTDDVGLRWLERHRVRGVG